ncbi:MAG: TetR/AcrR family transcriptional regulator [Sphingomonadales bacterium]|nr:TetR/AcrR family transcriptional regulator [Sphingomonadales bacterium]
MRQRLIDLAEEIVRTEGSAAVTAGRIAKEVGLGRHIVHYYFGTIDELLAEVIRRSGEAIRTQYEALLATGNPLRVIWDPHAPVAPVSLELVALSTRSEIVRNAVQHHARLIRTMLTQALERYIRDNGLAPNVPAAAIVFTTLSISQSLASEALLGLEDDHARIEDMVLGWIEGFERTGYWPAPEARANR